jgi:acyl transferase domain-containing protein
VPKKTLKWPENSIGRASVNSFGYGGTNAHVILEAASDYLGNTSTLERSLNGKVCNDQVNGGNNTAAVSQINAEQTPFPDSPSTQKHGAMNGSSATSPRLFPFSHNHQGGIAKLAVNLKRFISDDLYETEELLDRLAFTLSDRRSLLDFRSCVSAVTRDELTIKLEDIATGSVSAHKPSQNSKLCFAFTGMLRHGRRFNPKH